MDVIATPMIDWLGDDLAKADGIKTMKMKEKTESRMLPVLKVLQKFGE